MLIIDLFKALIKLVKLWGRSPSMAIAMGSLVVVPLAIGAVLMVINGLVYELYFVNHVLPNLQLLPSQDPYEFYKYYMLKKFNEPGEILIGYLYLEVIYQILKLPSRIWKRRSVAA